MLIRTYVFDAYGTLFDFASAAEACADLSAAERAALTALWRDKQMQYSWLLAAQGLRSDFWRVTGDALDYALESLGIGRPGLRDRLMNLYLHLETFPEVPEVLSRLKDLGFVTAILSNGTDRMLDAAVKAAGLERCLDAVLSVDAVGVFKPHPKVYQLAVDRLGVAPAQISFQSSNGWDAHAAASFGMQAVWCNRYRQKRERLPGVLAAEIASLSEMPVLIAR